MQTGAQVHLERPIPDTRGGRGGLGLCPPPRAAATLVVVVLGGELAVPCTRNPL